MEKIIFSPTNYPLIYKALTENSWLPPGGDDGKKPEYIDGTERVKELRVSIGTLNKVEAELETLTPNEMQVFLGYFVYKDQSEREFDVINDVVKEKLQIANNFFNRYENFI